MSSKNKITDFDTYLSMVSNFINIVSILTNQKDYDNKILYNKLFGSLKRLNNGEHVVTSGGFTIDGSDKKLIKTNSFIAMGEICRELTSGEDIPLTIKYRMLNDLLTFMYIYINYDSATYIDLRKFVSKKVPKVPLDSLAFDRLLREELQKHIINIDAIFKENNLKVSVNSGKLVYTTSNEELGE